MEFINMYAYSLRLDTSQCNIPYFKELLCFQKYLFGNEKKADGTQHLQGIVFFTKKLEKKHHDKLKKRISRVDEKYLKKSTKEYKAWSFVQGRKKVLLSYCMKDRDWVTNLSQQTLKKALMGIKEWKIRPDTATKKKELLIVQEKLKKEHSCPFKFNDAMIDAYFKIYHNMPRRNTQINWLYDFSTNPPFKKLLRNKISITASLCAEDDAVRQQFYNNDPDAYNQYWLDYKANLDAKDEDPYHC